MARKHRINNVLGLGSLPLTPRVDVSQPRLGLKKFQAEEAAREQAAKDAPVIAKQATTTALKQVLAEELFTYPSDELAVRCTTIPEFIGGTTAQIYERILAAARQGTQAFTLTESGKNKLLHLFKLNQIDSTNPENWKSVLAYACELGVMTPQDGVPAPPAPQAAPQPEPSIEHLSTENKEQRQEILRIVGKGWSTEFAQWFLAWIESLHKNFNYEFPIHELGEKAANFLQRHNLSPFVHSSWDKVRVAFVKLGYFPDALLVPSERLANLIEEADLSDRNVRLAFNRTQREINEAAAKQRG